MFENWIQLLHSIENYIVWLNWNMPPNFSSLAVIHVLIRNSSRVILIMCVMIWDVYFWIGKDDYGITTL